MAYAVTAVGQITSFDRSANGRLDELDRGCHRQRPEGSDSGRVLNLGSIARETMFLDQITSELCETKTLGVTVKSGSEGKSKVSKGMRGSAVRPVLHAEVHHAALLQAKQIAISNVGRVRKDGQ